MLPIFSKALASGTAASVVTTATLAALARSEGRHPAQATNSSSHWYRGENAGRARVFDLGHTLLGYATHHAASVFWATIFEALRRLRPQRSPLRDAVGVSLLAAVVDYAIVPKRITPGWEKVVTPASIGITYAAMALALWATCVPAEAERDPG